MNGYLFNDILSKEQKGVILTFGSDEMRLEPLPEQQLEPEPENHPPRTIVNSALTTTESLTPIADGWGYIHHFYESGRDWTQAHTIPTDPLLLNLMGKSKCYQFLSELEPMFLIY